MGAKKIQLATDRVVKELMSYVDMDKVMEERGKTPRYLVPSFLVDVLRDAVIRSSLHSYSGRIYCFDGVKYTRIDEAAFSNITYSAFKKLGMPGQHLMGKKWGMDRMLKDAAMAKDLSPDPAVVTFTNCVFDMDSKVTHRFHKKWVSVTQMGYAYDPEGHCFRWQRFLDQVLPDKEMQSILQEFLGCVFIDRKKAKIEKILVLLGPGANGKSVVHDVVRKLFGEENVTNFGLNELTSGQELKRNISSINGKRLNYASEISSSTFTHVGDQLKKLISGEPMSARANYKDNFMAIDLPLIMANANKLPGMNKDDLKAMSRRFIVVPFNVEIPVSDQNPLLARELCEELPGIFNWVMAGRDRYIANGYSFTASKRIEETPAHFKMETSTLVEFLLDRRYDAKRRDNFEQPKWVKSSDFYREYKEWCLLRGKPSDLIFTPIMVGHKMSELGYRKKSFKGSTGYGIYADEVKMEIETNDGYEKQKANTSDKKYLDVSGNKWIKTRDALAAELKVGVSVIRECIANGVFEGMVRQEGNVKAYNVERCRVAMSVYLKEKGEAKRSEAPTAEEQKVWVMRGKFNKKMERLGEPYRKYGAKMIRDNPENLGFTLVPDDWEYEKEVPPERQSSRIKRRHYNPISEINLEAIVD